MRSPRHFLLYVLLLCCCCCVTVVLLLIVVFVAYCCYLLLLLWLVAVACSCCTTNTLHSSYHIPTEFFKFILCNLYSIAGTELFMWHVDIAPPTVPFIIITIATPPYHYANLMDNNLHNLHVTVALNVLLFFVLNLHSQLLFSYILAFCLYIRVLFYLVLFYLVLFCEYYNLDNLALSTTT